MTLEIATRLRNTAKKWASICRGFHLNTNGSQAIHMHGQIYVGEWVYGYYTQTHSGLHLICGGKTLDEIFTAENKFQVIPDSVCRCTGLLVEKGDSTGKMLFEYDLVDANTVVDSGFKKRFFTFEDAFVFWHAPTLSWGIMTSDGKSHPFNYEWSFNIKGTIWDPASGSSEKERESDNNNDDKPVLPPNSQSYSPDR